MVWELAACFAAVLLLFTAVLGGVYAAAFRRHTVAVNREAMEVQAASIAGTLASFGGGPGMGRGRGGGYGAYLRFLNDLTPAEAWIVDVDRTLLAPGRDRMARESLPAGAGEIVERVLAGENAWGEGFSTLLDAPALTVGVPIQTEEGVAGAVLLHSPVSGVDEAVGRALSILCAGAAAALVLAGGAALWLSWRFTAPWSGCGGRRPSWRRGTTPLRPLWTSPARLASWPGPSTSWRSGWPPQGNSGRPWTA